MSSDRMESVPGRDKMWLELEGREPAQVQARSGARWSAGAYTLESFGRLYRIELGERLISGPAADPLAGDPEFQLTVLCYLNRAQDIPPSGRWVSERELPGGNLFFRGPHAMPAALVLRRFGADAEGFRRRCRQLGGQELAFGDAAFAFQALPRVPLAGVLYVQDEEFPARFNYLVDSTAPYQLPLDVILALAGSLGRLLTEQA